MDPNFKNVMDACIGASLPCTAWSTNGEVDEVINQAVEWAVKYGRNNEAIFVWRESVGFQEYGAFVEDSDGRRQVSSLDPSSVSFFIEPLEDSIREPEDDFPGATVPFAVEFIGNYNPEQEGRGAIFVLRDWHRYIDANADLVDRQVALYEQITTGQRKHVIAIGQPAWSDDNIPVELNPHMKRATMELPNKEERLAIARSWLEEIVSTQATEFPQLATGLADDALEGIADATGGLSRKQTENVICMSVARTGTFDIDYILNEKKDLVKQAGFTIMRPDSGFERIGGLTPLKEYATRLRRRFTKEAFDYGFREYPRGLLMAGVPGCGKTAVAKALAAEWGMNLVTVQATDLKGSLVGESEGKVRRLFDTLRAAAPIIAFVDEAEKLLGKSDGVNDGGAHDAVLGQFLSFMQEDNSGVFFVFTANNMEKFAPELVDRFEGRFFIDLPSAGEREGILNIHLALNKQDASDLNMDELVNATKDFSGRNIEDSIKEAMVISFNEDRPLSQEDLLSVFGATVPTSKTKKAEIETMRTFVENGMMRSANDVASKDSASGKSDGKKLRSFV